jgi:hypothetical protein
MSETGRTLPPFPVDDFTLDQLEHALNTCVEVLDDGSRKPVGGEFTLSTFLDFMSGYDKERSTFVGYAGDPVGFGEQVPIYESWDQHYSHETVIQALVAEIRRLRADQARSS